MTLARRTKITNEVEDEFLELIAGGMQVGRACKKVGVSRASMYSHKDKPGKQDFAKAWKEADEDGRQSLIASFEDKLDTLADAGHYRAIVKRLQALDPERYGTSKSVDVDINATIDIRAAPDYQRFRDTLLAALRPFPEAFQAVANAMATLTAEPPLLEHDDSNAPDSG